MLQKKDVGKVLGCRKNDKLVDNFFATSGNQPQGFKDQHVDSIQLFSH